MKNKNGIEIKFGSGRSLAVLSYAVWTNGVCQVSHTHTTANRKAGYDLAKHVEIERLTTGLPVL